MLSFVQVPKLEVAKRLFPDWSAWDAELTQLRRTVDAESHALDVQVLAEQ